MTEDPGDHPIDRVLDGGFRLRLIRPDDEPRLIARYDRLSRHTAYQRFFTAMKRPPTDWAHFLANVGYQTRLALVVEAPGPEGPEIVAAARGVRRFRAYVLADNSRMLRLLSRHTRLRARTIDAGVAELVFEPQG